jgi:hypothetical protein
VGPPNPRRPVPEDIRQLLGDPALRGDPLIEAISELGSRTSVESFRAVLSCSVPIDCPEREARDRVAAIERHRGAMEVLLGRDPGFTVAAFDLLHEMDRTLRDPVFRDDTMSATPARRASADAAREPSEDALRRETRRAERSGRSLAVAVLSPEHPGPPPDVVGSGFAALRDGARDIDVVLTDEAGDFMVLMPCTGGREGLRAADRFRRCLRVATGIPYCAGVAAVAGQAAEAHVLARHARESMRQARQTGAGAALHRAERRSHPRIRVGGGLGGRLRYEGVESEIGVEDLSLGGALFATPHRVDPGGDVVLALRRPGARPAGFLIPSRVLRVLDGPNPGRAPWKAAVGFSRDARLRVAALLAGLQGPGESA